MRLLSERLRERDTAEWHELLTRAGVPAAPVADVADVARAEQTQALGMLQPVEHPRDPGPTAGRRPALVRRRARRASQPAAAPRRAHGGDPPRGRLRRRGDRGLAADGVVRLGLVGRRLSASADGRVPCGRVLSSSRSRDDRSGPDASGSATSKPGKVSTASGRQRPGPAREPCLRRTEGLTLVVSATDSRGRAKSVPTRPQADRRARDERSAATRTRSLAADRASPPAARERPRRRSRPRSRRGRTRSPASSGTRRR